MEVCEKLLRKKFIVHLIACLLIMFIATLLTLTEVHETIVVQPLEPELLQNSALAAPNLNKITELKKKHHIYFLRTHKCGSTTVYAIFLRFGYVNNLTFVLPPDKEFPGTISTKPFQKGKGYFLPPPKDESYDILCHHTTYNSRGVKDVLPRDTSYIALVREPLAHFISAFTYFSHGVAKQDYLTKVPGNNISSAISNYLKNPAFYEPKTAKGHFKWSYTNNGMANDFGFPPEKIGNVNSREIKKFIQKLDAEFDFVMILEYLDESLVLMKKMLNWSIKDILYLGRDNSAHGSTNDILSTLSKEDKARHKQWASIDFALYKHFSNKLLKLIQIGGNSLRKEVDEFKTARFDISKFCESQISKGKLVYLTRISNEKLVIHFSDCNLFKMHNYDVNKLLKKRKKVPAYSNKGTEISIMIPDLQLNEMCP